MATSRRPDASKNDWLCKSCVARDGQPYRNFGSRSTCNVCGLSKGTCFGKKAEASPPGAQPTFAQQQLRQQKGDERHANALKKKDAELARLKAELQKREKGAELGSQTASSGQTTETEETQSVEVDAKTKGLEECIKHLEALPDVVKELMPDYSSLLASKKAALQDAIAAKWSSKPLKEQLGKAAAEEKRAARQLATAKSKIEQVQQQLAELSAQAALLSEAEGKCAERLSRAKAEVAELTTRLAQEKRVEAGGAEETTPKAEVNGNEMELILGTWALLPPEALLVACQGDQGKADHLCAMAKKVEQRFKQTVACGRSANQEQAAAAPAGDDDEDDLSMEIDDSQAEALAQILVEEREGEQKESRDVRVAAAKVKLKGKVVQQKPRTKKGA